MDSRFDCRDLLQRSVIYYEAERKASSAIISAPVQGVMTGTVASVARGPSEDRSSGLVSTQAGAFYIGRLSWRPCWRPLSWRRAWTQATRSWSSGPPVRPPQFAARQSHLRIHQKRKMSAAGIPPN